MQLLHSWAAVGRRCQGFVSVDLMGAGGCSGLISPKSTEAVDLKQGQYHERSAAFASIAFAMACFGCPAPMALLMGLLLASLSGCINLPPQLQLLRQVPVPASRRSRPGPPGREWASWHQSTLAATCFGTCVAAAGKLHCKPGRSACISEQEIMQLQHSGVAVCWHRPGLASIDLVGRRWLIQATVDEICSSDIAAGPTLRARGCLRMRCAHCGLSWLSRANGNCMALL